MDEQLREARMKNLHNRIFSVCGLIILAPLLPVEDAEACSFYFEDPVAVVSNAPRGGLWWFRGCGSADLQSVTLESTSNGATVEFPVAFIGLQDFCALRVPEDLVETEFTGTNMNGEPIDFHVTDDPIEDSEGDPAPPSLRVELRETRVGYVGVLSSPFADMCSQAPGLWNHHYADMPWLLGTVPNGFALDVSVRLKGETAFTDFPHANAMMITGRRPGEVQQLINAPPEGDQQYNIHARLIRLSDAAISSTQTIELSFSPIVIEERLEWVGCNSGGISGRAPPFSLGLLMLLAIPFVHKRRRTLRPTA